MITISPLQLKDNIKEFSKVLFLICSPVNTRPPSPKSDTEYEMQSKFESNDEDGLQWEWGELPTPQSKSQLKPIAPGKKGKLCTTV